MISIIIPSYREPYLQRTIDDIRKHAETDIEIIAVLDGYEDTITDASVITLPEKKGLANAINTGVRLSRGEYIIKTDGHCKFDQGFDRKLLEAIEPNQIVIPRRYCLNPDTWENTDRVPYDYEKLIIHPTRNKFHGERWRSRDKTNANVLVDETMCFQGSFWMMARSWWDTIGEMDTVNYGQFIQEPVELSFKTWQHGGKLMLNKNTWYSHKDRIFGRTHKVDEQETEKGYQYALETYGQYYNDVIKPRFGI